MLKRLGLNGWKIQSVVVARQDQEASLAQSHAQHGLGLSRNRTARLNSNVRCCMHWDLEPDRPRPRNQAIGSLTRTTTRTKRRFMEGPVSILRMHWDLELIAFPLARPSDTLSPTGGEGRGEGGTVHGKAPFCSLHMHWDHEPGSRHAANNVLPTSRRQGVFSNSSAGKKPAAPCGSWKG
jgi:hypothetical protein